MPHNVKAAIIGGTGLYSLDGMELIEEIYPDTPWGKPSDKIKIGKYKEKLDRIFTETRNRAFSFAARSPKSCEYLRAQTTWCGRDCRV